MWSDAITRTSEKWGGEPHRSLHPENCYGIQVLQHKNVLGVGQEQKCEQIHEILKGTRWDLSKWTLSYPCLEINTPYGGIEVCAWWGWQEIQFPH